MYSCERVALQGLGFPFLRVFGHFPDVVPLGGLALGEVAFWTASRDLTLPVFFVAALSWFWTVSDEVGPL